MNDQYKTMHALQLFASVDGFVVLKEQMEANTCCQTFCKAHIDLIQKADQHPITPDLVFNRKYVSCVQAKSSSLNNQSV
jgi:hypothetical protein